MHPTAPRLTFHSGIGPFSLFTKLPLGGNTSWFGPHAPLVESNGGRSMRHKPGDSAEGIPDLDTFSPESVPRSSSIITAARIAIHSV